MHSLSGRSSNAASYGIVITIPEVEHALNEELHD
jgi:hypothetical protein